MHSIAEISRADQPFRGSQINYGQMEPFLREVKNRLSEESGISKAYSPRWLVLAATITTGLVKNKSELRR